MLFEKGDIIKTISIETVDYSCIMKKTIRIISFLLISLVLIALFIGYMVFSKRATFDSPEAMKQALQGTYTYYSGSKGYAQSQIIIDGDTFTSHYWSPELIDLKSTIKALNYKFGTFEGIGKYVVLKNGDIKKGEYIYIKDPTPIIRTATTQRSYEDDRRDLLKQYERVEDALSIWDVRIENNSVYTVCTGKLSNDGQNSYEYVEVKGSFIDSSGSVLDTDWTYAVGHEGIAPGETTTFRLSVPVDTHITGCNVSILDYEKK